DAAPRGGDHLSSPAGAESAGPIKPGVRDGVRRAPAAGSTGHGANGRDRNRAGGPGSAAQRIPPGSRRLSAGLLGQRRVLPAGGSYLPPDLRPSAAAVGAPRGRLSELTQGQQVPLAVPEPCCLFVPEIGDALAGLQAGEVIFLELDAATLQLGDAGDNVLHEQGHLGMLSRGVCATGKEKKPAGAVSFIEE